jgi:DNA-damage-inducible protein D
MVRLTKGGDMSEFDIQVFEGLAKENGNRYWLAHEFMEALGYENWSTAKSVINKAISLCARIGVDTADACLPIQLKDVNGKDFNTYKLTRFGCLLVTMQADSKKTRVAQAQAALAAVANALVEKYINGNTLERLERREELKLAETMLGSKAQSVGVMGAEFGIFKSAGFRGMYNMSLEELKTYKGAAGHKGTLYDLMGITELAANTFRVTQTVERLKHTNATGLKQASSVAHQVGAEVRGVMIKSSGIRPEDLKIEEDVNLVKKGIKNTQRTMVKLDAAEKPPKRK